MLPERRGTQQVLKYMCKTDTVYTVAGDCAAGDQYGTYINRTQGRIRLEKQVLQVGGLKIHSSCFKEVILEGR